MTDEELLSAAVRDKMLLCRENYMIANTNFLDVYQQSKVIAMMKNEADIKYCLYGGFDDAERKITVFMPDYIDEAENYFKNNPQDNPITALRINKDAFSELNHRDYLGAIMGLGIKREMVGDIAVDEKGCTVAVMNSIAKYIIDNLDSVGRGSVNVTKCFDFSDFERNEHFEYKRCYVSSMRCDSVLAACYDLSRGTAVQYIEARMVFINGIEITKPDFHINTGDKVVLRGKGKVVIDEDAGVTKKGRQAFIIKKYV